MLGPCKGILEAVEVDLGGRMSRSSRRSLLPPTTGLDEAHSTHSAGGCR